jgi:hypothetical protein
VTQQDTPLAIAKRRPACLHRRVVKPNPLPRNASLLLLIAANLLPVAGVLLWGWSIFEIVSLYWFENVVIGVINILKMLTATGELRANGGLKRAGIQSEQTDMPEYLRNPAISGMANHGVKLFLIPFFTVHYGMFCFVHGIFVFTLLGGKSGGMMSGSPFEGMAEMASQIIESGGKWFVIGIIGSHLFSYFSNYIGKGEFRRTSAPELMMAPYGRIIVLHIAILFGAFVITAFGSPVYLLLLLIAGKIGLDAKLHLRSRKKFGEPPAKT